MTLRGWIVVFGAIVCGIILTSCGGNSSTEGNPGRYKMTCEQEAAFVSSGVQYQDQGGDRIVAINGLGQSYVMTRGEAQYGLGYRCQNGYPNQYGNQPYGNHPHGYPHRRW